MPDIFPHGEIKSPAELAASIPEFRFLAHQGKVFAELLRQPGDCHNDALADALEGMSAKLLDLAEHCSVLDEKSIRETVDRIDEWLTVAMRYVNNLALN